MLYLVCAILLHQDDLSTIDSLARGRDAVGLGKISASGLAEQGAFTFLTRPGPYGTGSKGWSAYRLDDPDGSASYVVFGTKVTSEDYGEYVFKYSDGRLQSYEDERDDRGYKISHYDIDLSFQPKRKIADVRTTVTLKRSASAASCAHFRLSPHYRVSKVTNEQGSSLKFSQASGVVSVMVPKVEESKVVLTYSGVVNLPTFAGAIKEDEVMLTNDYWWPMIARHPATVKTTARVPRDWIVVTHGKKIQDTIQGTERIVAYKMNVPISYLSFSAGPFKHVEKKAGRINYHVWSKEMDEEAMRVQLELMPPVIEFYETFSPYPFDDFGAMVTSLYGGGALEAYSYATYGTGWLPDEDGHEPAHTWWGGVIANTYLNSFWNESFAVFSSGLYAREVNIGNRAERREAFNQHIKPGADADRVACADAGANVGPVASSLGYGKGGAVLQQLETEIGTEAILASMRKWIQDNPKGEPGEWSGFERAVAETVGDDVSWFFDQWIRRPGSPQFAVSDVSWSNGYLTGSVEFSGAPYRITVDVYAELVGGGIVKDKLVLNPSKVQGKSDFNMPLKGKPTLVSLDPYDRLFRNGAGAGLNDLVNTLANMRPVASVMDMVAVRSFSGFVRQDRVVNQLPKDLDGALLIGARADTPEMIALCKRAGFAVNGEALTYKGTTIDLNRGAALAIVDLGGGKRCGIALGKTRRSPSVGNCRVALVDEYGRFLRGETEPRKTGDLVFTRF